MTPYDMVMAGVIVAGMIWGAVRGLTWQVASIASLVLGYLFAHPVSAVIAPYLPGDAAVQRASGMLAAYVVVSGGVFAMAWMIRTTLRKMKFEVYDRHLGMLLGGLEGALLGLIGTMFVTSFAPATREPIFSSTSGRIVSRLMDQAGPVLPDEIRKAITPFWAPLSQPRPPRRRRQGRRPRQPLPPDSDGPSLDDSVRRVKAQVGRAVGDAVKGEIDKLGDNNDRTTKRE